MNYIWKTKIKTINWEVLNSRRIDINVHAITIPGQPRISKVVVSFVRLKVRGRLILCNECSIKYKSYSSEFLLDYRVLWISNKLLRKKKWIPKFWWY